MSLAHLYHESEPMTILLTEEIAFEFGLVIRQRKSWSLTNIADECIIVNRREVPIGVAAYIRPFDFLIIGDLVCQFIPVVKGGGPNE